MHGLEFYGELMPHTTSYPLILRDQDPGTTTRNLRSVYCVCACVLWIPYFSAQCISDHRISNPNPSPDYDCSHLLVRDAVGRKGGQHSPVLCERQTGREIERKKKGGTREGKGEMETERRKECVV